MTTIYYTNGSDFFKLTGTKEAIQPILNRFKLLPFEAVSEAYKSLKVADTVELEEGTLYHYQPKK